MNKYRRAKAWDSTCAAVMDAGWKLRSLSGYNVCKEYAWECHVSPKKSQKIKRINRKREREREKMKRYQFGIGKKLLHCIDIDNKKLSSFKWTWKHVTKLPTNKMQRWQSHKGPWHASEDLPVLNRGILRVDFRRQGQETNIIFTFIATRMNKNKDKSNDIVSCRVVSRRIVPCRITWHYIVSHIFASHLSIEQPMYERQSLWFVPAYLKSWKTVMLLNKRSWERQQWDAADHANEKWHWWLKISKQFLSCQSSLSLGRGRQAKKCHSNNSIWPIMADCSP